MWANRWHFENKCTEFLLTLVRLLLSILISDFSGLTRLWSKGNEDSSRALTEDHFRRDEPTEEETMPYSIPEGNIICT
jgi:hypothetical protein